MIYSYIDTLLDKWVEWSEGFLSKQLLTSSSNLNTILGTTKSDNPTRANEFYKIGFLNLELTNSTRAYDSLRNSESIQSHLGYIAYLIAKAKQIDPTNIFIKNGFNAVSTICLIQQFEQTKSKQVSLVSILVYLTYKFQTPNGCDEKVFLRFLTAAMFCELNTRKDDFLNEIFEGQIPLLRIIDRKSKATKAIFSSSDDIKNAIENRLSLTGIIYEKGSVFFIGDPTENNPRGLFYLSYNNFKEFLLDFYEIEFENIDINPFATLFDTIENQNKISDLKSIFLTKNKNQNLITLMKTLEQGCFEAIKTLGWSRSSPIQLNTKNIIFYGAPGTGKSHKVKEKVAGKEERTERVTFHPEYDYNAFVGGYKPTMDGKDIRYEFVPQAFTKIYCDAWNSLASGKNEDFYLVIEEINRGNCAEIFGDIFQLLDRNSDYDISPSKELKEFLLDEEKGLLNKDYGLEGGKLKLPANLNILATMNTSDQSLFPMDSAFKRRWDWEYIPINYEESESNESSKFKVKLSENEYFSWLSFIKEANAIIKQNDNLGMDKCLGNYFIKPATEEIDIETFINKVIFYLWNDVFKDEMEENNLFLNKTTYEDFFPIQPNGIEKVKGILNLLKVEIKTE
jgi:hypothetical protein